MKDIAAHNLEGRTLQQGWKVLKKIVKDTGDTGGFFSVCYEVEKLDRKYFMKAFNINGFAEMDKTFMENMQIMSNAFQYEKNLSTYCQDNRVTKVSFVISSGEETMTGYTYPLVPYLIFNLADGDVRHKLNFSKSLDFSWKLKSLHDIATGIKQLHGIEVSHQDIKPSNILLFKSESKIGDLGRSMCPALGGPYDQYSYSGDKNYAPPEVWYQYKQDEWHERNYAIDCFLLGSMITYYISGISMSAHIMKILRVLMPIGISMSFTNDEPYLQNAFHTALIEIRNSIPIESLKVDIIQLIEYLCHPNPVKRGHPQNIMNKGSNYSLERFVSRLNILHRKAELALLKL
jgi:eukaryotic-like serine/threonine-protein kinase